MSAERGDLRGMKIIEGILDTNLGLFIPAQIEHRAFYTGNSP